MSNPQETTEAHIQEMRKRIPNYPYPYFPEECPRCNMYRNFDVHVIREVGTKGATKIILYDKETGEDGRITLWGPLEQCDDCGRKLRITKEKGVELLEP